MTVENLIDETPFVAELRQRMKGKMSEKLYADDQIFQRFLRARNYKLDDAEKMLSNHIQWRKETNCDNVLTAYKMPEVIRDYFTGNIIGFDREGAPIIYVNLGSLDASGFFKCVHPIEGFKFVIHLLEKAVKVMELQSLKQNRPITQLTAVFNFEKFNLMTATHKGTLEVCRDLVKMYEANFPERLKVAYVINASYFFTLLFAVLKPFITGTTFEKIHIFGKSGWQDPLFQCIHPDTVPAFLGGNRTDPDGNPLCKTIITHGGPIPKHYHVYRTDRTCSAFSQVPGVRHLTVNRMSKHKMRVEVTQPSTTIEWEFETRSKDIAFAVIYEGDGADEPTEVVPKQRVNTTWCTETGVYLCEKPGQYILEFDNTYSWINNKEICYRTSITAPNSPN